MAGEEDADVEFIEFVVCVWNLCTLTSDSVGKFLFELYDDDESGEIEFEELAVPIFIVINAQNNSVPSSPCNITTPTTQVTHVHHSS